MDSVDSQPERDQRERNEAVADRARAAADRAASAEDRLREEPGSSARETCDAESSTKITAVEYKHLLAAHERDLRAEAADQDAEDRAARAAITDERAGDVSNRDRESAAVDRASAAGDRNFAAQDRQSALRARHGAPSEALDHSGLGRDEAAEVRDQAASQRDQAAAVRDESAVERDQGRLEGAVMGWVTAWANAEAQMKARQTLREFEEQYRLLAANSTNVVWQLDANAFLLWVSPSLESVLGWRPEQLLATQPLELIHPVDHSAVAKKLSDVLAGIEIPQFESRMPTSDSSYRWLSIQIRPTTAADGSVNGVIVGSRDVDQEVLARQQVAHSERMFRLAMDGAPQGMAVVGLHLKFMEVNTALCNMLGRDEEWLLAHTVSDVIHPDYVTEDLSGLDELLSGGATTQVHERRWLKSDGSELWVLHSTGLLRDEADMPLFYVAHVQDVTDAHRAGAELAHQATHDSLTGLMNRQQLHECLTTLLHSSPQLGGVTGVLFCDLDYFKQANDTHGHSGGDKILKITAERISAALRAGDIVGRFGGDEFVVVLHEVSDMTAAAVVARKIRQAVSQPLPIGHTSFNVTLSIGIALASTDADADRLLRNADAALYEAKQSRRNGVAYFESHVDESRPAETQTPAPR